MAPFRSHRSRLCFSNRQAAFLNIKRCCRWTQGTDSGWRVRNESRHELLCAVDGEQWSDTAFPPNLNSRTLEASIFTSRQGDCGNVCGGALISPVGFFFKLWLIVQLIFAQTKMFWGNCRNCQAESFIFLKNRTFLLQKPSNPEAKSQTERLCYRTLLVRFEWGFLATVARSTRCTKAGVEVTVLISNPPQCHGWHCDPIGWSSSIICINCFGPWIKPFR